MSLSKSSAFRSGGRTGPITRLIALTLFGGSHRRRREHRAPGGAWCRGRHRDCRSRSQCPHGRGVVRASTPYDRGQWQRLQCGIPRRRPPLTTRCVVACSHRLATVSGHRRSWILRSSRLRDIRPEPAIPFEVRFENLARFEVEFTDEPGVMRIVWLFSTVLGYSR